jgi:aquaporin Z
MDFRKRWRLFLAELLGTAVLLCVGLSLVIFMFGEGSPTAAWIPSVKLRQIITGFLFGSTGGLIAISRIGRESGAHLNPAVTLGFWLARKIDTRIAIGYALAQLAGAVLGSWPLLAWGAMGRSIAYGATIPGPGYSTGAVLLAEALTTVGLIVTLCVFLAYRHLRQFTPAAIPALYAIMVPLEADISGTSTNPARTFGPALISGRWDDWWIYWVGPIAGTLVAMAAMSFLVKRIEVAKLYHFDSDRDRFFRRMAGTRHAPAPITGVEP